MNSSIGTPTNVAELLRSWTDEEKDVILAELIEEFIRVHGGKYTIPIRKPSGESLGYFVPPAAAATQLRIQLPELTPEQLAATQAAIANADDTFDAEEFFEELSRQDRD
jgi:hypothetical protein